jgi:hypothetical protein
MTGQRPKPSQSPLDAIELAGLPKSHRNLLELARPALARALADDPQQRFPTCRDFFSAVQQSRRRQVIRRRVQIAVVTALIALPFTAFCILIVLDRHSTEKDQTQVRDAKEQLRRDIARRYEPVWPKVRDLAVIPEVAALQVAPNSVELVEQLLTQQNSSAFKRSPVTTSESASKPLSQGSRPTVTLTITPTSVLRSVATGAIGMETEAFLFTDSGMTIRIGDPPRIAWSSRVRWSSSARRTQDVSLAAALVDGAGKVVGEKQTKSISTSASNETLSGSFVPTGLKPGDTLRAQVWLIEDGKEQEWEKSIAYGVGVMEKRITKHQVSASSVQSGGFELDSGIELQPGDRLRCQATGQITLGNLDAYKKLGQRQPIAFTSTGLQAMSTAKANFQIQKLGGVSSNAQHNYGALLMRVGQAEWTPYNASGISEIPGAGKLRFSLNGVRYVGGKELSKPSEKTYWWTGNGAFDVTLTVQSIRFPSETSDAVRRLVRASLPF